MLLAIDIGNTNTVFALFDDGAEALCLLRLQSEAARTADQYGAFLLPLFAHHKVDLDQVSAVLVSSVVPSADRHVQKFAQDYLGIEARFIGSSCVPLQVNLPDPSQLGADRLVNAYAAVQDYELPAVIVDFGTATTFDVISADGAYEGGAIAPGINLSVDALARATAKLPRIKVQKSERVIGKTTDEAIQSGIYWGYVGLISGMLERLRADMPALKTVIATGGLAPLFIDEIKTISGVDESLTLKGLYALSKHIK